MKKILFSGCLLALLACGCDQSKNNYPPADTNSPADTTSSDATNTWQKVKSASTNAWENVKQGSTNAWQNLKEGTTNAWAAVKSKTLAAWDDWDNSTSTNADYPYSRKDEFIAKAKADIAKMDAKIKEWSDHAAATAGSSKADAQAKIQQLKENRSGLDSKMNDVNNSTENNWDQVKAGFQDAYTSTKQGLKDAWQWLNDKLSS